MLTGEEGYAVFSVRLCASPFLTGILLFVIGKHRPPWGRGDRFYHQEGEMKYEHALEHIQ